MNSLIVMLAVPYVVAALRYRAYAESLANGTVLDWALSRITAAAPPDALLVVGCQTLSERQLLQAACGNPSAIILCLEGPTEIHQYHSLMTRYSGQHLAVMGLSHALGPRHLLSTIVTLHEMAGTELTRATHSTFSEALYVVRRSLLATLLHNDSRQLSCRSLTAAVQQLPSNDSTLVGSGETCSRVDIDVTALCGGDAYRWPEAISLVSAGDVRLLRKVLADRGPGLSTSSSLVSDWKRAIIETNASGSSRQRPCSTHSRRTSSSPTRILFASNSAAFTGAQQSLCHLISGLDRTRYEPLALVSYHGAFTEALARRGVRVICPESYFASTTSANLDFARGIMRDCDPDILHANHHIGMPLVCAAACADVPLVQHVRIQSPRDLRDQIHAADAVIAISEFVRQRLRELDIDPDKVDVIRNGVDIAAFTPRFDQQHAARLALGIPSAEFVVIMIARFMPIKKHDVVVRAVGKLRRAVGKGYLVLIGEIDNQAEYAHHILDLINSEGLSSHTQLIEFVSDTRSALHASDVLTLPAEHEPSGRAPLEAMAVGLPVVVSDSGGLPELVVDGQSGIIVPCGNAGRLAEALCRLAKDPHLTRLLGLAGAKRVAEGLTAAHCAQQTMALYERTLLKRGRSR